MNERQTPRPIPQLIPKEGTTITLNGGRRARLFPDGSMMDEATGVMLKGTKPAGQPAEIALRTAAKFDHIPKHVVSTTAKKLVNYEVLSRSVIITAESTNTGSVFIGGKGVNTSSYGKEIIPGASVSIDVGDLSTIYVVGTDNDKLIVGYTQ